jgi:hypothetical protein
MEIGWGVDASNTANIFEVYQDGTATLPEAENGEITTRGNRAIITKEYADANYSLNSFAKYDDTATSGQTIFTINDITPFDVNVFVNGVLVKSSEYTKSDDGTDTTITFNSGLAVNDWVNFQFLKTN